MIRVYSRVGQKIHLYDHFHTSDNFEIRSIELCHKIPTDPQVIFLFEFLTGAPSSRGSFVRCPASGVRCPNFLNEYVTGIVWP